MLSRETLYDSFKVNVYGGDVFHNYTKLKDSVMLESGDVLYFDGILLRLVVKTFKYFLQKIK